MAVVSSHQRYSTATDGSSFTSNNLNALGSTGRPVVVIQWANGTNRRLNSVTVGGTAIKILCGAGSSPNNAGWAIAVGADAVSGEVVASFSGNVSNIVITMLRCTGLPDEPFFDLNRASAFSTNVVQNVPPEGGLVLGLAHANNATAQTFAFTGMTGRYGLSGGGLQLDTTDSYGLAWDEVDGTSATITSQAAPSGSPTYRHYVVITLRNPVAGGRPSTLGKAFWKSETSSASYTTDNLASMSGGRPRVIIWSRATGGHSVTAVTIGGKAMAFVGSGTTQNHVTIAVGDEGDTGEIAVTYSSAPARVYIQMTRIQGQVGKVPIGGSVVTGSTDNAVHSVTVLDGGCFVLSTEYNASENSNGPYVTTSPSTLVERNQYSNNTNSFSIVEGYLTSASSPLSVQTDVNFTLGQRASAAFRGMADGTRWDRVNGIGSTLVVNDDDLTITGNDATFSYEMARTVHEILNEDTYWEVDQVTTSGGNTTVIGVCNESNNGNGWNGSDANSGGYAVDDGNMYTNGASLGASGIGAGAAGDRYGFHFKRSTRQLRVRRNNGAWSSFFTVVAAGSHYYISAGVGYLADAIRLKPATRDWTDAKPAGSYAIGEPVVSGVSATLSLTEANDNVSGAGQVAAAGTLAVTERPDTITAAGQVAASATLSRTEAGDTITAAGQVSATGTLAVTEQGDSITAAGSTSSGATGSLAVTEQGDSITAAGQVAASATLSRTEAGDTITAAGQVAAAGSLAVTEQGDSITAAGSAISGPVTGTLAVTEQGDTLVAAGLATAGPTGSLSVVERPDTIVAAATSPVAATLAVTERPDTIVAAGQGPGVTGSLSVVERGDTVVAVAVSGNGGAEIVTLQHFRLEGSAGEDAPLQGAVGRRRLRGSV